MSVWRCIRHKSCLLFSFIPHLKGEFLVCHSMSSVCDQKNFVKLEINMAQRSEIQKVPAGRPDRAKGSILRLEFGKDKRFETDLHQRVNEYFQQGTGRSKSGNWQMYLKTGVILTCFGTSYVLLVLVAETLWQGLLLVILLGLSTLCMLLYFTMSLAFWFWVLP